MFDDVLAVAPHQEPRRALYLRWRPQRFEDVVGQDHVTRTLRNAVKLGRPSHAYLFTGPRGTGKTSVARILYRAVNCEHSIDGDPCNACPLCRSALDGRALDLIEIDAASNRGIDDMRDLRDKVAYRPGDGRYKVYIVDEAHELTPAAWDAFLKTLEEPPPHAIFVLATTEAHKVPATIVSRCQRFDFRRIPYQLTHETLARVAASEGMQIEPEVLERLALVARGGLRDALSLLDQLSSFAGGRIDMQVARAALSLPSIEAVRGVLDGMTRRDPRTVMAVISDAAEGGADLRLFVEELVLHLRAVLLLRTGADSRLSDELPSDEVAWLRERAPMWSVGALLRLVQELSNALARTRDAQQFQVQTEVSLLVACDVETLAGAALVPRVTGGAPASAGDALLAARSAPTPRAGNEPADLAAAAGVDARAPAPSAPSAGEAPPPPSSIEAQTPPPGSIKAQTPPPGSSEAQTPPPSSIEAQTPSPGSIEAQTPALAFDAASLKSRWPDVIEQVKRRNSLLGSSLNSARPVSIDDTVFLVAFGTDFSRKTAERSTNRQLIEKALERVYGGAYRLRCTVEAPAQGSSNLLDDPVINYAARTFGGQPKRLGGHHPDLIQP